MALGDLPTALDRIRRGQRLFRKEKNAPRVALMEMLRGEALRRRGRRAEAERRARAAVDAFERLGLIRWESTATVLLDDLLERRETGDERIPRLRRLLRRLPHQVYPIPAYRLLEALGRAQEQAGRTGEASRSYRSALTRLEDLRVRIPTEDSKIAFLGDKTHLHDRLLAIEIDRPRPSIDRLFEWTERARAQSLWDRVRDPNAYLLEGERPRDRRLTAARRRLAWLHARISRLELGSPDHRARAIELRSRLIATEAEWSKALREDRERRSGRDRVGSGGPPSLAELRRDLPRGWGFLAYHIGPDFSLALAVTREGSVWRRLSDDLGTRLARLTDRLDFQWNAAAMTSVRGAQLAVTEPRTPSAAERLLQSSADAILSELHGLLWEPSGADGRGCIAALDRLAARRDPSHAASCSARPRRLHRRAYGPRHRPERPRLDERFLPLRRAAGGPPSSPGCPSNLLPSVARRGGARAGKLSPDGRFTPTSLPRSRACAGKVDGRISFTSRPTGCCVATTPPTPSSSWRMGRSSCTTSSDLRLPSSTVVLTACSSGRGAAPAGDEWIGLARGFLQAGASSVIASLWPIQDEPTLELMEFFYESFATGDAPAVALGRAMRSLMARRPHPWHWASFASLGGIRR